jgi:phosphomannomutase
MTTHLIQELMQHCGVKFGTSGARGLAIEMTDEVCYTYTQGFLQYLEQEGELKKQGETVAIAGDLRPSTTRIMTAVAKAALDMGYTPMNSGEIPAPAVALFGLEHQCPSVMVTGSHIPADRNGIKFNKCTGEILKTDEPGITSQLVKLNAETFNVDGSFKDASITLPKEDTQANERYAKRFLEVFPKDCLKGKKIGIYQHSAVGRDVLVSIFSGLGAEVTALGYSDTFIPVDTEAIRDEDVVLAQQWSSEYSFDTIISTDGDSDRPLMSDEKGIWMRGDILGILAARYLKADAISTPVSCNTAVEKTGWFEHVARTKIGSPFVVASMMESSASNYKNVVGYEANGGFLTNSNLELFGKAFRALPTRDAVLPTLAILLLSMEEEKTVSDLIADLPSCYTASGRIQEFPTEESSKILAKFTVGSDSENLKELTNSFSNAFGKVKGVDETDGLRVTFESEEVLHMRPSGNAPEFRCYNEASSQDRVLDMQKISMEILIQLKSEI